MPLSALAPSCLTMLPPGFIAILAMIVGWHSGVIVADLPSRLVPTDQAPVAASELAKTSRWHATIARSFDFVVFLLFFGGAALLMITYQSLFPGPLEAGLMFTFFGSLPCIIGIGRGAFEAGLGVGPDLRDLIATSFPIRYFTDSPEVRLRGKLRVAVCIVSIPAFFVLGGYYRAILGHLVAVVFVVYLLRVGPIHILDALSTFRRIRGTDEYSGVVGVLWGFGAAVFLLFGLGLLALGVYILFGFWEMFQH